MACTSIAGNFGDETWGAERGEERLGGLWWAKGNTVSSKVTWRGWLGHEDSGSHGDHPNTQEKHKAAISVRVYLRL